MELNVAEKKRKGQKLGTDNKAFESEEQYETHTEVDCESEANDAHQKSDDPNKSLLEQKMEALRGCLSEHKDKISLITNLVLAGGFIALVTAACVRNIQRALGLLVIFLVTIFFLVWDWIMEHYGVQLWEVLSPIRGVFSRNWFWIRRMLHSLVLVAVGCWVALDTVKHGTRQLVSFTGLLLLVFSMMLFSKHPFRWSWQTLLCGTGLQFILGLLVLRTTFGSHALKWLGNQIEMFLSFTDAGSTFVFGNSYKDHFFVFRVMPILVFLSSVISILYFIGFMPWLICKIGFIMQVTMGTSPAESMVAAGNIFLGHVDATHLLAASVMSAPASLAIAKIFWPEKEASVFVSNNDLKVIKRKSTNILEAASQGASRAVGLVGNIVTNIIAFLALLAFFDAVLSWLGGMFDYPQMSFSLICSYVFVPLSFMMGVSWEDSFIVAELIGIKIFLNEFLAFQKLSELMKRRKAGGSEYVNNVKQYISVHSETIATYALCGFSNFPSLGMSIGVLSAMAPNRRSDISRCGLRALIAGNVACFMTACIAGMLYIPDCPHFLSSEFNKTNISSNTQLLACCTQLYNSAVVYEPWNVTAGGGFAESSLRGCCALTPSKHFNCSFAL